MNQRQCGSCTVCCTVMSVTELSKPGYTTCSHVCERGCGVYADRPASCRTFSCLWLGDPQQKFFRNMERPDIVGIMLDVTHEGAKIGQALVAWETRDGAFREDAGQELLKRLSKRTLIVTIRKGEKRGLIGPELLVKSALKKMGVDR